jgi:hypothetical protein
VEAKSLNTERLKPETEQVSVLTIDTEVGPKTKIQPGLADFEEETAGLPQGEGVCLIGQPFSPASTAGIPGPR